MRGSVFHLDVWLDPHHPVPSVIYLDSCDYRLFINWLAQDHPHRAQYLLDGIWNVCLFKRPLNRYFPDSHYHITERTKHLHDIGIQLDDTDVQKSDEMFINEVQLVYFNNEPNTRRRAELLALARRQSGDDKVVVISQHRGFWRIPLVDTYYIDSARLVGNDDLPAGFDFLVDFDINRELVLAVQSQLGSGQYGHIMLDALVALEKHIQNKAHLTEVGHSLMERAFRQDGTYLCLNPLTDPDPRGSQQNEQKGFRELYCGAWIGLRNPLAHVDQTVHSHERLPDKRHCSNILVFEYPFRSR